MKVYDLIGQPIELEDDQDEMFHPETPLLEEEDEAAIWLRQHAM